MSKHWRPDENAVPLRPDDEGGGARRDWARLQAYWQEEVKQRPLPPGATAGLLLVALACMGVAFGVYQAFGPRNPIAPGAEAGWNSGDDEAGR